jgi:hypothetical protein
LRSHGVVRACGVKQPGEKTHAVVSPTVSGETVPPA